MQGPHDISKKGVSRDIPEDWTEEVTQQTAPNELIEENFNDILKSWLGESQHSHPKDFVESEDEDADLKQMSQRGFSIVTQYGNENSFDSLMVEKKMILKMNLG